MLFFANLDGLFFFVSSMGYRKGLSSPLAWDVISNTRLKMSAA
jgi:hypothetical protein